MRPHLPTTRAGRLAPTAAPRAPRRAVTAPRAAAASTTDPAVTAAVATVKRAAAGGWRDRPPPADTLAAILTLEKAKLPADGLLAALGGDEATPGRRWRLAFTSGTDAVRAAMAGGRSGGVYVPVTAVQGWNNAEIKRIENGVYLGWVAALKFEGPFNNDGRRFAFDFDAINVRLGPKWFRFPLPKKAGASSMPDAKGPFFLFIYADDAVAVARGRSGGVAIWGRVGPEWAVKAGLEA